MFRTDAKPSKWIRLLLAFVPFLIIVPIYMWGAYNLRWQEEHAGDNATASSKLMPLPSEMVDGVRRSIQPDARGDVKLVLDTIASVRRFTIGMAVVAMGIVLGLYMGTIPILEALLFRFFVFFDKVPPLLLLPILFIVFDVGEFSKIALVVAGVLPGVVLDAFLRTREIPREQFYKAQALGASESEIIWTIVYPQIFPKMLGTLRLNFKSAWCYVIAGEAIAAAVGIGYRIFVLRRYVAMDVIIPYVIWATLIMFLLDYIFQRWEKSYRWMGQ